MGVDVLVGSTGLVGGNLLRQRRFSLAVHSTDVSRAFGTGADLVVYAGVTGTSFLANSDPAADRMVVEAARENIRRIAARKTVLVSSVNVYADSRGKDEGSDPGGGLGAYGANRLMLERWVQEDFPDTLVVRLPALFGHGLKKNFLFDLIHLYPPLLMAGDYRRLASASRLVGESYLPRADGSWGISPAADLRALRRWFAGSDFNALSFTDSRSRYQFYPLMRLWGDIDWALRGGLRVLNVAPPPMSAGEVHERVTGEPWSNRLPGAVPADYDMRSKHLAVGPDGYLCTPQETALEVVRYVNGEIRRLFS